MTPKGIVVAEVRHALRLRRRLERPRLAHSPALRGRSHEIDWDGSHVWAAATANRRRAEDRSRLERPGGVGPHVRPGFERFGLRPRPDPLDGTVDYRIRQAPVLNECHVNGVARWNGATVINCGLVRKRKPLPQRLGAEGDAEAGTRAEAGSAPFGTKLVSGSRPEPDARGAGRTGRARLSDAQRAAPRRRTVSPSTTRHTTRCGLRAERGGTARGRRSRDSRHLAPRPRADRAHTGFVGRRSRGLGRPRRPGVET